MFFEEVIMVEEMFKLVFENFNIIGFIDESMVDGSVMVIGMF